MTGNSIYIKAITNFSCSAKIEAKTCQFITREREREREREIRGRGKFTDQEYKQMPACVAHNEVLHPHAALLTGRHRPICRGQRPGRNRKKNSLFGCCREYQFELWHGRACRTTRWSLLCRNVAGFPYQAQLKATFLVRREFLGTGCPRWAKQACGGVLFRSEGTGAPVPRY